MRRASVLDTIVVEVLSPGITAPARNMKAAPSPARERERERESDIYIYIYIYICKRGTGWQAGKNYDSVPTGHRCPQLDIALAGPPW